MTFVLALDQGTSSSRAILFDESAAIVSSAQTETTLLYPHPSWVEQDPHEILQTQIKVIEEVLHKSCISPKEIATIGITNQRESIVAWNKVTGKAFYNAIIWQDARTSEFCNTLKAQNVDQRITQKTGLVIHPYFSSTKIHWLLNNVPEIQIAASKNELCFGTIDSWLIYNLTKGESFVTDHTNASRTMLYNIHESDWDDELLALFKISRDYLPKIQKSSSEFGVCRHILPGCKISGVAGDQHAALFGQCCYAKGMIKNTYGTGCFLLMNTAEKAVSSSNKILTTLSYDASLYALEGSVFIGGAAVSWLRDGLQIIGKSSEVETLALSVQSTDGVYFVPAFSGLGAPYWDTTAEGLVTGLKGSTTKAHIARATIESLALQTADVIHAMIKDSGIMPTELRVDGGASMNNTLLQFQADILDIPVVRPHVIESTARGAAFLAGLTAGVWSSQGELSQLWKEEKTFLPHMNAEMRSSVYDGWYKAIRKARLQ